MFYAVPGIARTKTAGIMHIVAAFRRYLNLLTLLIKPALDLVQHHVIVNAGDREGNLNMLSHPEHLWVVYCVFLFHSVSFTMFGKHAFRLNYGHMSYAMPDQVGVDMIAMDVHLGNVGLPADIAMA